MEDPAEQHGTDICGEGRAIFASQQLRFRAANERVHVRAGETSLGKHNYRVVGCKGLIEAIGQPVVHICARSPFGSFLAKFGSICCRVRGGHRHPAHNNAAIHQSIGLGQH